MIIQKFTVVERRTGRVLYSGRSFNPETLATDAHDVVVDVAAPSDSYLVAGAWVQPPAQPSPAHVFDWATKQWADPRTLQDLKDAKWTEIKQARSTAELGNFTYNGKVLNGDLDAQRRLAGYISVSKSALASGTAFSAPFTLADNTETVFTAQDFVGIELAKVQAVAAVFAKGVQLRDQIEAAAAAEELALLHW